MKSRKLCVLFSFVICIIWGACSSQKDNAKNHTMDQSIVGANVKIKSKQVLTPLHPSTAARKTVFKECVFNPAFLPERRQPLNLAEYQLRDFGFRTSIEAWRAMRNFGPFFSSGLNGIQIRLENGGGTWFFNNFLNSQPSPYNSIFSQYLGTQYPGNTSTISLEPPQYTPGKQPGNLTTGIQMSMSAIRYSSKHGGSVELLFKSIENYEIELKNENMTWDVGSLEMRLYVIPKVMGFRAGNPGLKLYGQESTLEYFVELSAKEPIQYQKNADNHYEMLPVNVSALDTALNKLSRALVGQAGVSPFAATAFKFTHALLHCLFDDYITSMRIVQMIEIKDDYLSVYTRDGIPTVYLLCRVETWEEAYYSSGHDFDRLFTNLYATYNDGHQESGQSLKHDLGDIYSEALDKTLNVTSTDWDFYYIAPFEQWKSLNKLTFGVRLVEHWRGGDFLGGIFSHDHTVKWEQTWSDIIFDINAIQEMYNQQQLGEVNGSYQSYGPITFTQPNASGYEDMKPTYTFGAKVVATLR
jgi:hypothetical protein